MDTSDRLFELLREGVLDVAIGRIRDEHRADYAFTPLENEALALVVGVRHPLAQKKTVKFASLLDYPGYCSPPAAPCARCWSRSSACCRRRHPRA